MTDATLTIALLTEVYPDREALPRLDERLAEARAAGAAVALLPELPLNPWSPATKDARDDDAEAPGGWRFAAQQQAARTAGIGLIGGVIERDARTGRRLSRGLVFDPTGTCVGSYCKVHLPEEPGFWETSHYEAGAEPPAVIDSFSMKLGVQICSDMNRPEFTHLLGALGAEVVCGPRATEEATYPRWRTVLTANALTTAAYVVSVNRPGPDAGIAIGGPSLAIAPDGTVLLETTDPLALVTLERQAIRQARLDYPGYLPVRADLYARAWAAAAAC